MNKITLADVAANAAGIKKKDADVAVNAIFAAMANELAAGGKVQIAGFGNFKMKERVERVGRNPKSHEPIVIPSAKVVNFTAGKQLKELLNK